MEYVTLNNKLESPVVGIGTFMLSPADAENSVREALKMGYRLIYASENRGKFAHDLIEPIIVDVVNNRDKIKEPSDEQMIEGVREVLEEIADVDEGE